LFSSYITGEQQDFLGDAQCQLIIRLGARAELKTKLPNSLDTGRPKPRQGSEQIEFFPLPEGYRQCLNRACLILLTEKAENW